MSTERVRAYLLGLLSDSEAAEVEERYFADAGYLRLVEARESELIAEYLDGRLRLPEKDLFEKRYREVPLLKQKVEAARREKKAAAVRFRWRAVAVVTATLVIVLSAWTYSQSRRQSRQIAGRQPAPAAQIIGLFLAPGLQRGVDTIASVTVPPHASIRLSLELPGVSTPQQYVAHIRRAGSDEAAPAIWTGVKPFSSQPSATGQVVQLILEPGALAPDDYIVELQTADGAMAERYVFRLVR